MENIGQTLQFETSVRGQEGVYSPAGERKRLMKIRNG